jgi:ribosome-associated protein
MSKKKRFNEIDLDDDFEAFIPNETAPTAPAAKNKKAGKQTSAKTAEELEDEISKSQIKREMHELKALGERVVGLAEKQLARIPMSEELEEAVLTARRIKSNNAKKRQLQYIGKVMRRIDPAPIQAALDEIDNGHKAQTRLHHKLENLRDKLIEEGTPAIEDVLKLYPLADRQQLRLLIRQAKKELDQQKPPAASRKLFKCLKEVATPSDDE